MPERTVPETLELVRYGRNDFTRDGKKESFEFSGEDADRVIAEFEDRKRDLVIDFEHQTLSGERAPAAGWIDKLEKGASGLVAHVKYWTDAAADYLKKGEYRYFSPTLLFSDHEVSALHSVALTNHPALHKLDALVAGDVRTSTKKGHNSMPDEKTIALTDDQVVSVAREILGLSDATAENVRGKLLALKTQADLVPGLRNKIEELEKAADAEARKLALADLLGTGRLSSAQAESAYFKNLSLDGLRSYREATPEGSVVPLADVAPKTGDKKREGEKKDGDNDNPVFRTLGLSAEDREKYKEACK